MANADIQWMRRALALARRGEGVTRPNPPVGAVIVREGQKVGEGWHQGAGLPHAEVEAVKACSTSPRGTTLYVTLEPCSTHGRTPPCTDLILASGITRVVAGCVDPNPDHAGKGFDVLRRAGITVDTGCCEEACTDLIAPFAKRMLTGLPYVTLKLAMTLDGKIADRKGRSTWITGEKARAEVQRLRRRADAVMVGAGTACADDPSLTCRLPGGAGRWRVVIDGAGRVPATAKIFTDGADATTVVCTTTGQLYPISHDSSLNTVLVWPFAARQGRLSLRTILRKLAAEGLLHVVCEGGGNLAGGLLRGGLIDEAIIFLAPALMGDERGVSGVRGADFLLNRMPRFALVETRVFGEDVMIRVKRRV